MLGHTRYFETGTWSRACACWCLCSGAYLEKETLWAGELVVPHGLVHEQEQQAGQEGQRDEDQAHDLSENKNMSATKLNCP